MATQTIRVTAALSAGSYTVNVQADGSNTNAFTGRTLTAESVASFWTFTVTSATAGLYAFQILNGSSAVVAYGWFYSGTDAAVTIPDSNSRDEALQTKRIGLPSGESIAADIAAVKAQSDEAALWSKRGAAVLVGTISTAGTSIEVYTLDGVTVTATVDSSGNRSSVVFS